MTGDDQGARGFNQLTNAVAQSGDQTNLIPFLVRECKGLVIAEKFLTNLL